MGGNNSTRDTKNLYSSIIGSSFNLLKKDGWLAIQGGASKVCRKYIDITKIVTNNLEKVFGNYEREDVHIPSFGENGAFLFSKK